VQNVTYAQNAWVSTAPYPGVAPSTEGTYALGAAELDPRACVPGRPAQCWRDCFKQSIGAACLELASMFEVGYGVVPNHDNARRLAARACELGECGPPRPWRGDVTSPGAIIVYGDFKGNVLLGH
jgi:hypothetical protein